MHQWGIPLLRVALGIVFFWFGALKSHHFLRIALILLLLQMAGTFFAVMLSLSIFFLDGNPFLLTVEGEFVVKNIVLIAGAVVIGGYEIKRIIN